MKKQKTQNTNKGITLIALVITIVVMLILVAVTISMAVNGGLFEYAANAGTATNGAVANEQLLASGQVTIDNTTYNSIDEYIGASQLPIAYEDAKFESGFLAEKASYESDGYTAIIPKGFKISEVEGEKEISTGLVIKDANNNEFVWIPVNSDLTVAGTNKVMARETSGAGQESDFEGVLYDFNGITSQEMTNYGHGTSSYREPEVPFLGADNGNIITIEALQEKYNMIINSIKQYKGFYVSRYEMGTTNSTPTSKLGQFPATANWYGLYDIASSFEGETVFSSMIWGSQYDAMLNWMLQGLDKNKVTDITSENQYGVSVSGANPDDVLNNIYDLSLNAYEWTTEVKTFAFSYMGLGPGSYNLCMRRGGAYYSPASRSHYGDYYEDQYAVPELSYNSIGTRFTLMICDD